MDVVILCVAANPALDVTYRVNQLERGSSHRVGAPIVRAGGKAVNVASVLGQLGYGALVAAPLGGHDGELFRQDAAERGIPVAVTSVDSETRRSIAIVDDVDATLFNERGRPIDWPRFAADVIRMLDDASVLVIAGSLPSEAPDEAYADLVKAARSRGVRTIVDAAGVALVASLAACPDIVAPNLSEARDALAGGRAGGVADAADPTAAATEAATKLSERGARRAVVSMGATGAVSVAVGTEPIARRPPASLVGNPTGAGDAFTAALAIWANTLSGQGVASMTSESAALMLTDALAAGAAAVPVPHAGEIDIDLLHRFGGSRLVDPSLGPRELPATEHATNPSAEPVGPVAGTHDPQSQEPR